MRSALFRARTAGVATTYQRSKAAYLTATRNVLATRATSVAILVKGCTDTYHWVTHHRARLEHLPLRKRLVLPLQCIVDFTWRTSLRYHHNRQYLSKMLLHLFTYAAPIVQRSIPCLNCSQLTMHLADIAVVHDDTHERSESDCYDDCDRRAHPKSKCCGVICYSCMSARFILQSSGASFRTPELRTVNVA